GIVVIFVGVLLAGRHPHERTARYAARHGIGRGTTSIEDLARHRSALYSQPDGPATLRRGDHRGPMSLSPRCRTGPAARPTAALARPVGFRPPFAEDLSRSARSRPAGY